MAFEMLVGLHVINDEKYAQYRAAMRPLLTQFKGDFGYDFNVSKVLKAATVGESKINRVFTIFFENQAASKAFFTDPDYLAIKAQYFEHSVAHTEIISSYEKV